MPRRPKKPDIDLSSELEFEEYAPQLRRLTPRLRPDAGVVPQTFRGQTYFVLQDPITLQFYRVAETEREVLGQLDGRTTLGDIHDRLTAKHGVEAPSFRHLVQFVFMLRQANLTVPEGDEETRWTVERAMKKRRQRLKQRVASFMYVTIPLFDPERFLNAAMPYVRWAFSKWFFAVWVLTVGAAFVTFLYHADSLMRDASNILAPGNLLFLYVAFVVIKTFHEFGHAFAAKHYGAEVHRMGVMFLIFMPCWYVDTTPIWALPRKWPKALVGAAGMLTELFLASLALFAWLTLEQGTLRTILYNAIFIASVSTIIFNGNPLLRYDAYYILADILEIPNLRQHASQYLSYLMRRYLIGERMPPETRPAREKTWFLLYGVLSFLYRSVVVVSIVLYVASQFLIIGVVMAMIVGVLWVMTPLVKLVKYVFFGKSTRAVRWRAVGVFAGGAAAVVVGLGVVPMPTGVRAPCALEAHEERVLRAEWPGFLTQVLVKDGDHVRQDQVLAVVTNEELDYQVRTQDLKVRQSEARLRELETRDLAAAQAEAFRQEMLRKDLAALKERQALLTFRAPFDGQVIAPNLARIKGRFLLMGEELFTIASLDRLRVVAVVDDADIEAISRPSSADDEGSAAADTQPAAPASRRAAVSRTVRVKFASYPDRVFEGTIERVHPAATNLPPPRVLTHLAGGPVLLDPRVPDGRRTLAPWWRVEIALDPESAAAAPVRPGAAGTARFVVGEDPLGRQLWLAFRRLLQKRFLV
jgi:putative peptide zinc metalloprotease protein